MSAALATAPSPKPATKPTLPPVLSLDDRILAALRDHAASVVIANLITECEDAVTIAERQHAAAKERAIDPTTPGDAVAEARRIMEDRSFIAERMREAARRLDIELGVARVRETAEKRQAEVDTFVAERDALVRDLREQYPDAAATILGLIKRVEASNRNLVRLRLSLDASAEAIARGLPPNFYAPGGSPIPRFNDVRLPEFSGHGYLWPPAR